MPGNLIKLLDGTEKISIVEETNFGARTWFISDVDGVEKFVLLGSSGRMMGDNYWIHFDYFVEDGNLITALKIFRIARSKLALDHWASGPLDQCLVSRSSSSPTPLPAIFRPQKPFDGQFRSLNDKPASQSVQYIHLTLGLAGQVVRVVHPVPDHLSRDQHPQWQHLQVHI